MTTRLHQVLAVERDLRQTSERRITDGYQALQKPILISGLTRTYNPKDEEGEALPPESTRVQVRATTVLQTSRDEFERLWDLVATKDYGNLTALADVKLKDGTVLIAGAPATYLLWLEKQLNDLHTIVAKLPILDPAEDWSWSREFDCYVTAPVLTNRSKKVPRVLLKAEATVEHPAQTEVYTEDVVAGTWSTTKFSGALPATDVRELLDRVNEVREAVKIARSAANEVEVEQRKIAAPALDYVFAKGAQQISGQGSPGSSTRGSSIGEPQAQ